MAQLAVRLEPGLERMPVDTAVHAGSAASRQLVARLLGQHHERPEHLAIRQARAQQGCLESRDFLRLGHGNRSTDHGAISQGLLVEGSKEWSCPCFYSNRVSAVIGTA